MNNLYNTQNMIASCNEQNKPMLKSMLQLSNSPLGGWGAFCLFFLWLLGGAGERVFAQVPTITSFSPTSGVVGTSVTITGTAPAEGMWVLGMDTLTHLTFSNVGGTADNTSKVYKNISGWTLQTTNVSLPNYNTTAAQTSRDFTTLPPPTTFYSRAGGTGTWADVTGTWATDMINGADCGCSPAGVNGATVTIAHNIAVNNTSDFGLANTIDIQDGGNLILNVLPTNSISVLNGTGTTTGGVITMNMSSSPAFPTVTNDNFFVNNNLNTVRLSGSAGAYDGASVGSFTGPSGNLPNLDVTANSSIGSNLGVDLNINGAVSIGAAATLTLGNFTADRTINFNADISIAAGGGLTIFTSGATPTNTMNLNEGATLTNNGTFTLTNSGAIANIIYGTFNNLGDITLLDVNGTPSLNFHADAVYNHQRDGGTIPFATWEAASNCNITGITSTPISSDFGQTFGNFTWNCPGQTVPQALGAGTAMTVAGNFSLTNTNSQNFTADRNMNLLGNFVNDIGANFIASNNTVSFNGTSPQNITGNTNFHNLTIANIGTPPDNTVTMSSSPPTSVTVGGTLHLSSGILVTGANELELNNSVYTLQLSGTPFDSTKYIVTSLGGKLIRENLNSILQPVEFPIGATTSSDDYTPLTITNTGSFGTVAVSVRDEAGAITQSPRVNRIWNIATTGTDNPEVQFNWNISNEYPLNSVDTTAKVHRNSTAWTNTGITTTFGNAQQATATIPAGNTGNRDFAVFEPYFYSRKTGAWSDVTAGNGTWSYTSGGSSCDCFPPNGANVVIEGGFTVTTDANNQIDNSNITLGTTNGTGTLDLGTTTQGTVATLTGTNGNGVLKLASNNLPVFTAETFFNNATNTVEFYGGTYNIPNRDYPSLEVSGTGSKIIGAGVPVTIRGNLKATGGATSFTSNATVIFPNSGILPHLIQGVGGNVISFTNIIIDGNTTVEPGFGCFINNVMTINAPATFINDNQFFHVAHPNGNIDGSGTFTNKRVVNYQSNITPTVTSFDLTSFHNTVVYEVGSASPRLGTYDLLYFRAARSTQSGNITANSINFDNSGAATLNLVAGTNITTNTLNNTNPSASVIDFGTGNATLTVNNGLNGGSTLEIKHAPAAGNTQLLDLKGIANTLPTFTTTGTAGTSTVRYSGAGSQTVFGSNSYQNLVIDGSGTKTLQGAVTVNNALTLNSGVLNIANNILTLSATIASIGGTPSTTSYIATTGTGTVNKLTSGGAGSFTFPIGFGLTGATYAPITVNHGGGTGVITAKVDSLPTPPITATNRVNAMWSVNQTGLTLSNITFNWQDVTPTVPFVGAIGTGATVYRDNAGVWIDAISDGNTLDSINASSATLNNIQNRTGNFAVFASPSITVTPATPFTAFTSCAGTPSAERSYTVSGTNLSANIVITAPTGFEISLTSGGPFSDSLSLTPTSGTVATTTIYVRQTAGASNGASGNITHTSTGATQVDKAILVSVVTQPNSATITYTGSPFCSNAANPTPIILGTTGGTFSSTVGLNFVSTATGEIDLATSTAGTYTITYTMLAVGDCPLQTATANVTINPLPTITGVSAASVNNAATSFSLVYTGTTASPDQYSISTGSPNAMAGFTPVTNAPLPSSPISVTIPAGVTPNTYNFNLTVRNSTTGCVSAVVPFTLTVTGIYYSKLSGNWNVAANWSVDAAGTISAPNFPSAASDEVIIQAGHTITVPMSINTGNLTINGVLDLGTTTGHTINNLNGAGTLRLSSGTLPTVTNNNFVTTAGTTVEFYGATTYSIPAQFTSNNYQNVLKTNTATNNFAGTILGTLTVNSGNLNLTGNTTVNGNINLNNAATMLLGTNTLTGIGTNSLNVNNTATLVISGTNNFPTNFASYNFATGSQVFYDMSGNQNVSAQTYGNLLLGGSGIKTLQNSTTTQQLYILNALTTLSFGAAPAKTLTVNDNLTATNGTIDMQNAAHILNLAGANNALGTLNTTNGSNSTINYNGNISQTVFASNSYQNLTLEGNSAVIINKTLQGNTTVNGNFLIRKLGAGDVQYVTAVPLTLDLKGNFTNTLNANVFVASPTNLITFTGTGNQTITGIFGTTGDITITKTSGEVIVANSISLNGANVTITNNTLLRVLNTASLNLGFTTNLNVATPSATKMIILEGNATLRKYINAPTSNFLFPIGTRNAGNTADLYAPATLNLTSATFGGNPYIEIGATPLAAGVTVPNGQAGQLSSLRRYWTVNSQQATAMNGDLTFGYNDPAELGTPSTDEVNYVSAYWNGTTWAVQSTVNTVANTFSYAFTGSNSLASIYTAGSALTFFPSNYYSLTSGNWNTPATWTHSSTHIGTPASIAPPVGANVYIANNHQIAVPAGTSVNVNLVEFDNVFTQTSKPSLELNVTLVTNNTITTLKADAGNAVLRIVADAGAASNVRLPSVVNNNFVSVVTNIVEFEKPDNIFYYDAGAGLNLNGFSSTVDNPLPSVNFKGSSQHAIQALMNIRGNVNIDAMQMRLQGASVTLNNLVGTGTQLNLLNNSNLFIDDNNFPINFATYNLANTSTVIYQLVPATVKDVNYGNLAINISATLGNNVTVNNTLTIAPSTTLNFGTAPAKTLTINGSLAASATGATINMTGAAHVLDLKGGSNALTNLIAGDNTLVRYSGSNPQNVFATTAANPYPNLEFTGAGAKTLPVAPNQVFVKGNWTNNGATINTANTTVTFNGTGTNAQIIGGVSTTFNNLTINNTGAGVSLGVATTANNVTFTNGKIDVATFAFSMPYAGTVTGAGTNSYFITTAGGQFRRTGTPAIATPYVFPVGTAAYTPFTMNFSTVAVGTTPSIAVGARDVNPLATGIVPNALNASTLTKYFEVETVNTLINSGIATGNFINPTELRGTLANYLSAYYDGTAWQSLQASVTAPTFNYAFTGLGNLTASTNTVFTAGEFSAFTDFVVKNTNDTGVESLRDKINLANIVAGADTITFLPALAGQSITVNTNLPIITQALTIDGSALTSKVKITKGGTSTNGFTIGAAATNIYGLEISGFDNGIFVNSGLTNIVIGGTSSAQGNYIHDNSVGVYMTSSGAIQNNQIEANTNTGLLVSGNANTINTNTIQNNNVGISIAGSGNIIGNTVATKNIIAGNTDKGIEITSPTAVQNRIRYNEIYGTTSATVTNPTNTVFVASSQNSLTQPIITSVAANLPTVGQATIITQVNVAGVYHLDYYYTYNNGSRDLAETTNLLGSTTATLAANTPTPVVVNLLPMPSSPQFITVIATDTNGNSSPISNAYAVACTNILSITSANLFTGCSGTRADVTITLSNTALAGTYNIDINGDGVMDYNGVTLSPDFTLLLTNVAGGNTFVNTRVQHVQSSCLSSVYTGNSLTIPDNRLPSPILTSAKAIQPTSCTVANGRLVLKVSNPNIGQRYEVNISGIRGLTSFAGILMRADSTLIVENLPVGFRVQNNIAVSQTTTECYSNFLPFTTLMVAPRDVDTAKVVYADLEDISPKYPTKIVLEKSQDSVEYRIVNLRTLSTIGQTQRGNGGTLTFITDTLEVTTDFAVYGKHIRSECELQIAKNVRVNVIDGIVDEDMDILREVYRSTNGDNWFVKWDFTKDPSTFIGVKFFGGRVTDINLNSNNLSGTLTTLVNNFKKLVLLNISNNRLDFGSVESFVGRKYAFFYTNQDKINNEEVITEFVNKEVTLRVQTQGNFNRYQWYKDGQPITNATAPVLSLTNLKLTDAGIYTALVTNTVGTALTLERRAIRLNVVAYPSALDSMILIQLNDALGGSAWTNKWDRTKPVAQWYGVTMVGDRVTSLNLANNNLTGEIPDVFVSRTNILTDLVYLNLSGNNISGRLPQSITNLRKLQYLDLSKNLLTGEVVQQFGTLTDLRTLWLSNNRFTNVHSAIANLKLLENLLLDNNQITTLPTQITTLSNLKKLGLGGNQLTTLPTNFDALSNLEYLALNNNQLATLPDVFGSMTKLTELYLQNNKLTALPPTFARLTALRTLFLHTNGLDFGDLEPLKDLPVINTESAVLEPQEKVDIAQDIVLTLDQLMRLTVNTAGTANRYQWLRNGVPIATVAANQQTYIKLPAIDDAGVYTVQITNDLIKRLTLIRRDIVVRVTCGNSSSIEVSAVGSTRFCEGETINTVLTANVNTSGVTPVAYQWFRDNQRLLDEERTQLNVKLAGEYTVQVRDNQGCIYVSQPIKIEVFGKPTATLTQDKTTNVLSLAITNVAAGRSPLIDWYVNGTILTAFNGQTSIKPTVSGNYYAVVTDVRGCPAKTATVPVTAGDITAIEDDLLSQKLKLYPNPTADYFFVETDLPINTLTWKLYNGLGQLVNVENETQNNKLRINAKELPSGVYILEVEHQKGRARFRLVKE